MHLRKVLTFGAAVLAAGLLSLTPISHADPPPGGPAVTVEVNGDTTAGAVSVTGVYSGGTQNAFGRTMPCPVGGGAAGTVTRGPRPLASGAHDLVLSSLTLVCGSTPISHNIWLIIDSGCAYADFFGNVYDDTVDRVDGVLTIPLGCMRAVASGVGGTCSANVSGTIPISFDEVIRTVGGVNYQQLILNGTGLTYSGQNLWCATAITGGLTLNNVTYDMEVTSGTTTGIDFRETLSGPPSAGPIATVGVNGATTAGDVPIDGTFKSGTATYDGGTFSCLGGTTAGTVERGPRPLAPGLHDVGLDALSLSCATPLGINGTWSLAPGCVIAVDFADTRVHDGTFDTGTGPNFSRVDGQASVPSACITLTVPGGCTAKLTGSVNAYFDEAIKTVGGVSYQELILNGTGLTFSNQTLLCFNLMSGGLTLNNFRFDVQVTSGTTTGIDFRHT